MVVAIVLELGNGLRTDRQGVQRDGRALDAEAGPGLPLLVGADAATTRKAQAAGVAEPKF